MLVIKEREKACRDKDGCTRGVTTPHMHPVTSDSVTSSVRT